MAGRYDRNPFDDDDVNPFAVSRLLRFFFLPASPCYPAPRLLPRRGPPCLLFPGSRRCRIWSGSPSELLLAGFCL